MVTNYSRDSPLRSSEKFLLTSPVNWTGCAHIFHNVREILAADIATGYPVKIMLARYGALLAPKVQ
jgi:hypothetical protein